MIRIGYVGVNTWLPSASKAFRLAGYSEERMLSVARANILALEQILRWNLEHDIRLFRITSKLVPFGSSPVNSGSWRRVCYPDLQRVGHFVMEYGMRVSMHPGQYTVIGAPVAGIQAASMRDLEYHCTVLDLMGLSKDHKIVIHGGGAYGHKEMQKKLLIERLSALPIRIGRRLAIENDERIYSAEDILEICTTTGLPAVLDVLHHVVLPSFAGRGLREVIQRFGTTWNGQRQKIHYSNQETSKHKGAHSETLHLDFFAGFYAMVKDLDLDIMLEVKDKQESVLKLRAAFPELR